MSKSMVVPTHDLTISLREGDYRTIQSKAKDAGLSEVEMTETILTRALRPPAPGDHAPWALDVMTAIETILNQYFTGLPHVLDQLAGPERGPDHVFRG